MLNTFAKFQLQLCNNVVYISYCELFSYCSWALYHFGLETEHFHGHDCRNSGPIIANLELRTERQ